MDITTLPDDALLRLISSGRAEALSELYDRYGRLIYSLALRIAGDGLIAEELTQEVFLQVWRNAAYYQVERGRVVTWMASITRYRSIDRLRRVRSRPPIQDLGDISLDSLAADSNPAPEEVVSLMQQRRQVQEAVDHLPPDQKQVLLLAFYKGYSHSEIAESLGLPLGTVKTRIRLGMQKLRIALIREQEQI
ncbi:MAG TPA: sigma-70 family RNA polymerase sigma factor [Anaerolineales bacterium]|nr:sigma-70 family RNA polymerase sigma factor [Anaerolineales bacterium]